MSDFGVEQPGGEPPGRDEGIDWLDEPDEPGSGRVGTTAPACWRCGKVSDASLPACPHCQALPSGGRPDSPGRPARRRASGDERILPVLYLYLMFLASSVILGFAVGFHLFRKAEPTVEEMLGQIHKVLVVEVIDAAIVVAGIFWAGRPSPSAPVGLGRKVTAWVAAWPALAALLALNFAYFFFLRTALGVPAVDQELLRSPALIPWVIAVLCVQPAIVEELFFRYLALGHLCPLLGPHGAVWVSAVMFGLAHIANPLGMPYLIVAGAVFGYARIYGRSLAIPMLMHFLHNGVVIWSEPWL